MCFSLLSMQGPGDGRLSQTVSSIVSDTWGPECNPLWPPEAGGQGVSPVWALKYGLALAGPWWSSVGGQGAWLASLAEWSCVCVL